MEVLGPGFFIFFQDDTQSGGGSGSGPKVIFRDNTDPEIEEREILTIIHTIIRLIDD